MKATTLCPGCRYSLEGLAVGVACPECGRTTSEEERGAIARERAMPPGLLRLVRLAMQADIFVGVWAAGGCILAPLGEAGLTPGDAWRYGVAFAWCAMGVPAGVLLARHLERMYEDDARKARLTVFMNMAPPLIAAFWILLK